MEMKGNQLALFILVLVLEISSLLLKRILKVIETKLEEQLQILLYSTLLDTLEEIF